MSAELRRHPESRGGEAVALTVEVSRQAPSLLSLRYLVIGRTGDLRLPPVATPERTDELWRSTCFEAFVARRGGGCYEFNFAPSTRWAAYSFDGYRAGMMVADDVAAPRMQTRMEVGRYELKVALELGRLLDLPRAAPWSIGLSAVIEDGTGAISYWALNHPPGKPDFHHPDSFAYELPLTDPA